MLVIKIKNPDCSESYYVDIGRSGVITAQKSSDARPFYNPSRAKMEMLKLILDCKIPRKNMSIEQQNEIRAVNK